MEPLENSTEESGVFPARWAGLGTRAQSALILAVICFLCVWLGGLLFTALVMVAVLVMKKEWDALLAGQSLILRAIGYVYVILPCASLVWLRGLPVIGLSSTVALIAMITATDIGAYFVGRSFGKHKLSPVISPNKTWEGLAGGIIASVIAAFLFLPFIPVAHTLKGAVGTGILIALLAQGGDLFESSLKRKADVKDSGTILPGHGGLLDRFDGYMFATPIFALIMHSAVLA